MPSSLWHVHNSGGISGKSASIVRINRGGDIRTKVVPGCAHPTFRAGVHLPGECRRAVTGLFKGRSLIALSMTDSLLQMAFGSSVLWLLYRRTSGDWMNRFSEVLFALDLSGGELSSPRDEFVQDYRERWLSPKEDRLAMVHEGAGPTSLHCSIYHADGRRLVSSMALELQHGSLVRAMPPSQGRRTVVGIVID